MVRAVVLASLCVVLSAHAVEAQLVNRNGAGGNFANGPTALGNAGGFATGGGLANGTTNSANFGAGR